MVNMALFLASTGTFSFGELQKNEHFIKLMSIFDPKSVRSEGMGCAPQMTNSTVYMYIYVSCPLGYGFVD